jgi:hypothetical protein
MKLLAASQAGKTRAKVAAQQEAIIKIGARPGWGSPYDRPLDLILRCRVIAKV